MRCIHVQNGGTEVECRVYQWMLDVLVHGKEVHYEDQVSCIELDKREVDQWIEDKAAFAGRAVDMDEAAHYIGGHIEVNLRSEGITL